MALIVYVDDVLMTRKNEEEIVNVQLFLYQQFTIKNLGYIKYFFGSTNCKVNQWDVLKSKKIRTRYHSRHKNDKCKIYRFSFSKGLKLDKGIGEILPDPEQYKRLIGHFLYLGMTRLDIKYFTRQLNQYMQPRKPHLQVALDVVKYLKGCPQKG